MFEVKLFVLLYLVYMVNAEYPRTPLKRLSIPSKPEQSKLYSDILEINEIPTSLTKSFGTRTKRGILSIPEPEFKTVRITKRPTVNPYQSPPRYHPNRNLLRLIRQMPSELSPELELGAKQELEPQIEIEFEPKLEPETNVETILEPKFESEDELESQLKLDSDQVPLSAKPKTPDEEAKVPIFRPRSTLNELVPGTETKIDTNLDGVCQESNAFYAISHSCDTFFECQKFIANIRVCPDGLLFNPKAKWPRYPCSYPTEVECGNNTKTDKPITSAIGECPRLFGTFASSSNDCEKYIVCENGRPQSMSCPMGLGFNAKVGGCDWPSNIPNCNPNVFRDFICPVTPEGDKSDKVYNYRYKNSCKLYITCIRGEPRLLRCDSGLSFDDKTLRCISSAAVSNCRTVSELVDTKLLISKG